MLVADIVRGSILYANRAAAAMLGYSQAELRDKQMSQLHAPEMASRSAERIAEVWEQKGLVYALLSDAGATPQMISCGEMHGTGTALGDPIEVGSYEAGLLSYRTEQPAAALGSVKASVGHAEPGAGLVGLAKLTLMLNYARSPPNTLLRVINPQVSRALGSSQAQLANQIGQQWDGMNLSKMKI